MEAHVGAAKQAAPFFGPSSVGRGWPRVEMKLRIAIWAGVGALVVVLWSVYISGTPTVPVPWTIVYLTCPIAVARHYALSSYLVLLVNAGTYALVGRIVEIMRGHRKLA